ncbi:unnamed protein product [Chondrus crispus]|uniref:Uncharacterized protein n=1 Tax=Chondrus crispus TaxID=2769 RepID=R7QEC7_CHOCR|nr:unnamed protein product [Chondrus crispus]CDF36867.1 unnamed protein product [Chondrus crispus]|eukprot:XP_005716686.1 unnamed protein product [Chondrus crispus]
MLAAKRGEEGRARRGERKVFFQKREVYCKSGGQSAVLLCFFFYLCRGASWRAPSSYRGAANIFHFTRPPLFKGRLSTCTPGVHVDQ